MDSWHRKFAYLTGAIVIGLLLILLTNRFLHYVNEPGSSGYIALFAFGLIYLNLGYGINRRFSLKSDHPEALNYLLSTLIALPTLFWIYTKDEGLGTAITLFTVTILFALYLGTYFGSRRGVLKRAMYQEQIEKD